MEYPDHPRPPITVENVNSVMGKDSKKKVGGKESTFSGPGLSVVWF